jgi:basic membrane protein A
MKKAIAILLAALMLLSVLSACGAETKTDVSAKQKRIAVICGTVGTNLFLTQIVDEVKALQPTYNYDYSIIECSDADEWQTNYESAVMENYDLIVGVGWESAEYANNAQLEHPDAATYVVIDTDAGNENVTSITYNEEQAAYIMGVMAGAAFPKEKQYGFIDVFENSGWEYRWGFMEGVKSVNPGAKFLFNYTNNYSDTSLAYEYANQQQAAGCTYIFGCAAASNEGIFQAALELAKAGKPIYSVGQDADATTPDNPYILSSQLKNTGVTMGWVIENFLAGTLPKGLIEQDLADGAVGATHITNKGKYLNEEILTPEVIEQCKQAVDDIVSGKLVLKITPESEYDY